VDAGEPQTGGEHVVIGHVVIIGGGTGGLCLAQALKQNGVRVSVYERAHARTERTQGYLLHINPYGSRVLRNLLPEQNWDAFVSTTGAHGHGFGFLDEQLREQVVIEDAPERDPAAAFHSVSRITLHQVLSTGLEDVVHHGKEFERYSRNADGTVTCHFTDGTSTTADVVVGADGARSRVRAQYLPHAERVDTGMRLVAGKYPLTPATRRLLPGRLLDGPNNVLPPGPCGMFISPHDIDAVTPDGIGGNVPELSEVDAVLFDNTSSYVVWAFVAADFGDVSELDGEALRAMVADRTMAWHPTLHGMVIGSPAASVTTVPLLSAETTIPRWPTTNVTLLGDAIHSMTPFRGIGANVALRDAELLARNLIEASHGERDVLSAIDDYERHMTVYGFAAVRESLRAAKELVSGNRTPETLARTVRRFFPGVSKAYWRVAR
jgi:2-polyprenyl-6-methoxyphenol hydroxylase-like FAD-dependent oxidoreductase